MLKNKMEPGNSGIVTLVETERVQELITAMKSVGGQIYQQKINDDIISELAPPCFLIVQGCLLISWC